MKILPVLTVQRTDKYYNMKRSIEIYKRQQQQQQNTYHLNCYKNVNSFEI